jgi:hypothetical protein
MKASTGRYALIGVGLLAAAGVTGMFAQHGTHEQTVAAQWSELRGGTPPTRTFDPRMTRELPAPAQRWLRRAIAPGTPLYRRAVLRMDGFILRRQGEAPQRMRAEQVLAPPRGFIWKAEVGIGRVLRIHGFDRYADGAGELRWWLFGLVPIVRSAGDDVTRSAAGRLAGEAVLVPATLLPTFGVRWEPVSENVARATMDVDGEAVSFTIDVATDGRLKRVVIDRWNSDPRNGDVGYLPFVVEFDGERVFDGFTIPAHVRAGWEREGQVHVFFDAELRHVEYR